MESEISIRDKEKGKRLGVAGGNYRVIVSGDDTDQSYAVIEMTVPPGGGPPPHSHPDTHEIFYVLEGEVEIKTEKGKEVVSQGGFVTIPLGGAIHCFKNTSDSFVKLLCTVMPAGLEKIFEAIGQPVAENEFLPVPEMTEERKSFLKHLDELNGQKTYDVNYLD
ncbi:cupin domain-containing protein [Chryseobacterium sp. PTM-20240506]|uniref:cupin domain-containing protein n=1 Tax=unclassified Chryseobacterium TaxID=2593645 RepID=UPI0023587FFC|nr:MULTISPECIES: cupin domain-containing protein [unclassified Chryseobacterium]MDC8103402.1 cupin domain-containing protein [Chryseobacterium sp. B21-037]MDQ1802959.1 cupin domain-containing protein [Chryseobacterium sp. CKR4-1]